VQLRARGSSLQTLQSKVAAKLSELSATEHRFQPAQVRVSLVAGQSEDSLAGTASLARHLRVRVLANRGAEKNADNPESINLRPHRLPVRVRAKREVEEREGKVPMVNLAASQKPARLLRLSVGNDSRSVARKRARGLHRHADHNNSLLIILAAPEQKSGAALHKSDSCSGRCVSCNPLSGSQATRLPLQQLCNLHRV
jgi:hypothetical protein